MEEPEVSTDTIRSARVAECFSAGLCPSRTMIALDVSIGLGAAIPGSGLKSVAVRISSRSWRHKPSPPMNKTMAPGLRSARWQLASLTLGYHLPLLRSWTNSGSKTGTKLHSKRNSAWYVRQTPMLFPDATMRQQVAALVSRIGNSVPHNPSAKLAAVR